MYDDNEFDWFNMEFEKLLQMVEEDEPMEDDEYCDFMKSIMLTCSTDN